MWLNVEVHIGKKAIQPFPLYRKINSSQSYSDPVKFTHPEPGFLVNLVRTVSVSGSSQFGMVLHNSVSLNPKRTKKNQQFAFGFISCHQNA